MHSARTHCPACNDVDVVDLAGILYSPRVDFFRCGTCFCSWVVPKNDDGPATQVVVGELQQAISNEGGLRVTAPA